MKVQIVPKMCMTIFWMLGQNNFVFISFKPIKMIYLSVNFDNSAANVVIHELSSLNMAAF